MSRKKILRSSNARTEKNRVTNFILNYNYSFTSKMALMKNTKRNQPGLRYPLAEYQKKTNNNLIDFNSQKIHEFIKCLLHDLIDKALKSSEHNTHDKSVDDTTNQNVELIDQGTNKENYTTAPMHGNDKLTKHLN